MAKKMNLEMAAKVTAGIGAVNWGLVEFASFDLVAKVVELVPLDMVPLGKILYGAVAVAGAYLLYDTFGK